MSYELVVFGGSMGGFQAVQTVLKGLGSDFNTPIVIVLHRDKSPGELLCQMLQNSTHMRVHDADDGEKITPGNIYLAPPGYHLLIDDKAISLSCEPPVNHAQPSIDVAFDTAARCYGDRLVGVALTSSSRDGVEGVKSISERSGVIIVQAPGSAENATFPLAAIEVAPDANVVSLQEIPAF